jgi:hypothetical protein
MSFEQFKEEFEKDELNKQENNMEQYYEKLKQIPDHDLMKLLDLYERYKTEVSTRAEKWKNDPDYRKRRLDSMKKYNKKRYDADQEYREKKKNQAKERYYTLKVNSSTDSFGSSDTTNTPKSGRKKKGGSISSESSYSVTPTPTSNLHSQEQKQEETED